MDLIYLKIAWSIWEALDWPNSMGSNRHPKSKISKLNSKGQNVVKNHLSIEFIVLYKKKVVKPDRTQPLPLK